MMLAKDMEQEVIGLNLALGLGMIRRTARVCHLVLIQIGFKPPRQIIRDIISNGVPQVVDLGQ